MEPNGQGYAESAGTGVMVSNLPLLFTRGFPSSLHVMKLDELEDFVPFMVRCSLGEENPVQWSQLPRPTWWPRKLPFRIPSGSTPAAKQTALIGLVERCYSFHGCEYLLQFCASLLESMPVTGYRFNDNRDGTTSMYHGTTGRLLVTFRNENRDYDKSNHDMNLRKKLLLSPTRVSSSGTTTAVFQPAATDIYLCDKCENEFYSLREVQIHEKKCCGDTPPSPVPPSPDPEPVDEEPEPAGQVPFLSYFNLQPAKHTGIKPYMSPRKRSSSPPRKLIGSTFPRFDSIALTSPLGRFLVANSKLRNKYQASQHLVIRYERHLHATPHTDVLSSRERCTNRWIVVWRPNKEEQPWYHLYCFNKAQRREQRLTIKTGLNLRSRRLLSTCHPLRVTIKRLQKRIVDRVTRLNGPTAPCIDLTDEPQRLFADLLYPGSMLPAATSLEVALNGTQRLEDPLRLFYDSSEETLNLGASSSSSSQATGFPEHSNSWGGGMQLAERDPLGFSPGDIIQHDSISLVPLPRPSLMQNRSVASVNSNANHVAQHSDSPYQSASLIAAPPGPKCSKRSKHKLLRNKHPVQQNSDGYTISNCELIKLSQGDYGILNKLCSNVSETSVKAASSSGLGMSSNCLEQNSNRHAGKTTRPSTKYSQSVPQVCENDSMVLPLTTDVNTSNVPLPSKKASIEVIDLSSDDDDAVRVRGYSEADHAPSQLDGLACYPHSGAKVPGSSSKLSMPKNGNSHWSSNCKSHCDSGRVGDLATNGQPPNVLNDPVSPVPGSLFLPTSLARPTAGNKVNPRKRRCEEPLPGDVGRKLMVLDVSNHDGEVWSSKEVTESDFGLANYSRCGRRSAQPMIIPVFPQKCDDVLCLPAVEANLPGSNQSGAFVNNDRIYQNSTKAKPSSTKVIDVRSGSVLENSKDDYRGIITVGKLPFELAGNSSGVPESSSETIGQELSSSPRKSSRGLFENIVSTVSKGVEFICSLVGTTSTSNVRSTPSDRVGCSSKSISVLDSMKNHPMKNIDLVTGKSLQVPRVPELRKLLGDECRELHRKGLGNIRFMNVENVRLTRRSMERVIPSKAQKKQRWANSNDVCPDDTIENTVTLGVSSNTPDDVLSTCIDENGNSPSYVKTKLKKGAQYEAFLDNNAKQSNYFSLMEHSNNNNNNNNNNNSLEQPVNSRKDMTFTDHYRGSVEHVKQTRLRDSACVISVDNGLRRIRDLDNTKFGKDVTNGDVSGGSKCSVLESRLKGGDSSGNKERQKTANQYSGKHNGMGIDGGSVHSGLSYGSSGNVTCVDFGEDGVSVSSAGYQSMELKRLMPVKKSVFNSSPQSSVKLTVSSRNSEDVLHTVREAIYSMGGLGKTAEECGALQARVPTLDRLHYSKLKNTVEYVRSSHSLQNASTGILCQRSDRYNSDAESNYRKISSYAFSEIQLQKVDTHRTNSVSKNLITDMEREMDKKGFQSSSSVGSSNESRILGNGLHSSSGETKDHRMRSPSGMHLYERKESNMYPSKLGIKRIKKKRTDLSQQDFVSLEECEGSQSSYSLTDSDRISWHSSSSNEVDEVDNDIENMPLRDRLHSFNGKVKERRSRLSFDVNHALEDRQSDGEMILQTSTSSGKSCFGSGSKDSACHYDKMSKRENSFSQSKNLDDTDKQSVIDKLNMEESLNSSHEKRKRAMLRELSNLGKDEWKEMQKSGIYPFDVHSCVVKKASVAGGESDDEVESDTTDNEPLSKRLENLKNGDDNGDTCSTKPIKKANLPRELLNLSKDEWKEAHGTSFHPSYLISTECRQMLFGSDSEDEDPDLNRSSEDRGPSNGSLKKKENRKPKICDSISKVAKSSQSTDDASKPMKKKTSIPRELRNLGKDEWKEMRNSGFHPADLVGSENDEVTYFVGESEEEEEEEDDADSIENEPPHRDVQPKEPKGTKKMSRELMCLLNDECKELKRKQKASKTSFRHRRHTSATDDRGRNSRRDRERLNSLGSNQYANSVLKSVCAYDDSKSQKDQPSNRYATARNTRSQTNVVKFVEVLTPRDSHRQLLHTETAMCVLNFNLPLIK